MVTLAPDYDRPIMKLQMWRACDPKFGWPKQLVGYIKHVKRGYGPNAKKHLTI